MPTQDQILVPETLLKKRKSQEKQREEDAAQREKRRQVGHLFWPSLGLIAVRCETPPCDDGDDTFQRYATRLEANVVANTIPSFGAEDRSGISNQVFLLILKELTDISIRSGC